MSDELHTYILNILVLSDKPLPAERIRKLLKRIYGYETSWKEVASILRTSPYFVKVGVRHNKTALWTVKPEVRQLLFKPRGSR
ncbi:MAG: hypothetical protein DRJ67_01685 [Thermoprotei archaeon]|nr:MAG: hypothetical protein DRJ67_01685 [Thermoprotei archaeon]